MKIGIICSSNGGVFKTIVEILEKIDKGKYQFICITDRKCGFYNFAVEKNFKNILIDEKDNRVFSQKTKEFLDENGGVDTILLFFSRLVTKELFISYPTCNIHPSLLPAFKGFKALEKAKESCVRFIGSTLHQVDDSVDGGAILAQAIFPFTEMDRSTLERFSYYQKVYLFLLLVDFCEHKKTFQNKNFSTCSFLFNPVLKNKSFYKHYESIIIDKKFKRLFHENSYFSTDVYSLARHF